MKEIILKYRKKIGENKYLNKIITYLKENKINILILLVTPIILANLTNAIFEETFWSDMDIYKGLIKTFSFSTIIDDIRCLMICVFTNENKLEYLLILALELILLGITGKIKTSMSILTVLSAVLVSINRFVFQLRGIPLTLLDFLAAKTAVNIISGYELKITATYIGAIIISVILLIILFIINKKEKRQTKISRVMYILLGIIFMVSVMENRYFKELEIWELSKSYMNNGQYITLLKTVDNVIVDKPDDYSKEFSEKTLQEYDYTENNSNLPNIIVVMNESFSDLKGTYNMNIEDNMPFYNSLEENIIKGNAYTSVLGGSTSTVEWEFLTGNTPAFIPYGTIPYLQYIDDTKENLVSVLNQFDYNTMSLHSFKKTGYNRPEVYRYLGFKESFFIEDMEKSKNDFTSFSTDTCTYENYFKFSEKNSSPKFGFIVTIQNHSPYQFKKDGIKYLDNKEINTYLNLINQSDKALELLIQKLKNENEKTLLLFFGDHQPEFIPENIDLFKEKEWMQNYKVPFLIWANYDIEEQENVEISVNYLSVLLAEIANTPKSSYMNFLSELKKEIPVITANGYKDKNGKVYEINDEESPYYELINKYNILQYYQMFDKEIE